MLAVVDDTTSPFEFHGPLDPSQLVGREELVADLSQRLLGHRPTALLGPRRYGKTSVLRKVAADLAGVGPETIWIDLYGMSSNVDFAVAIDRGLSRATGRLRRTLKESTTGLSVRLGVVGFEFNKPARDQPDPDLAVHGLLRLLVDAALRHPTLIVLDEFSGLANVNGGAAKLRTYLQHHYREISLAFAGSEPSTMTMMFADRAEPFFAQADLVRIDPLAEDVLLDHVADEFERTSRDVGRAAERLVAFARGHPQRAMQLADALWRHTPERSEANESSWAAALEEVRAAEDPGSERLYSQLPAGHQRTLRAVATDGAVYGHAAKLLNLSPGTASKAVTSMLGNGWLLQANERLDIVDPIFADWIRRRLPVPR